MSRHVQNTDNSVLERRLRPIYDSLDSGNNKKALQECEKVLKKSPNIQIAKALKALTLHRMGWIKDATQLLDSLIREKPTDETTLQAITTCYREMNQLDKICRMYETAVKMDPSNEDLLTALFMSYVRINDFSAQQKAAVILYKQKPKNPYYCWMVMSNILLATRGEGANDEKKKSLFLGLAERMMLKYVNEGKLDAEQEVQLYIMVLDLQQKYEQVLEVLDGPLSERLHCTNIPQWKIAFYKKLKRWTDVNIMSRNLLIEHVDRWDMWKEYIHSVFELMGSVEESVKESDNSELNSSVDSQTPDTSAESCHEFICSTIENWMDNPYYLRGPHLARFELYKKLHDNNPESTELLGNISDLFLEYFKKFGHKTCCVSDLKIYLHLLNEQQRLELAAKLIQDVGISATSVPKTLEQMQRHICALQLSRLCGSHKNLSSDHLKALVTAFTLHYQHGYQSFGKDLPSTDLGPSDYYAILAAHILYDLSVKENDSKRLIIGFVLLENLLKFSPSNFHAKLLALKFYHILGNGVDANTIFYSLDIKHLQFDSLGYVHCARLPTLGLYSLCNIHFDNTLKFFTSNYRDSVDHLTLSYKFGSFIKLDEFMDFRERMNNSLHYNTTLLDRLMMNIIDCSNLEALCTLDIPQKNPVHWNQLRDNKDLNVYVAWEPELTSCNLEDTQLVKDLFEQDLYFLKLKTHIVWCLSLAVDIFRSVDGTKDKQIESLRQILENWKELDKEINDKNLRPTSENIVIYPFPSRLFAFREIPYFKVLSQLFEFFVSLANENVESMEKMCPKLEQNFSEITTVLEEHTLKKGYDFREKRKSLEYAANCIELVCLCSVVCLLSKEYVKPVQGKKAKKKPTDQKNKELLNVVVNKLISETNKISEILETWSSQTELEDIENILESLNLDANKQNVYQGIVNSYATSNKEMQTILKNKIKTLNGVLG